MSLSLGAHVGQQNLKMDEMRALWRMLDDAGMDWISAWDHIYEAPPAGGTVPHFEAVATLAALAMETTNARIGCLVFYVGYRNPGLLAKAAVTIDHLANGRFELGIGGGWHEWEAEAYGYDFPSVGTRLDMLDEAAELITGLLRCPDDVDAGLATTPDAEPIRTSHDGKHFKLADASCLPGPYNGHMPLWIGGVGEKRTLRTTAKHADGWNAAYISAEEFGRLNGVLDRWCEGEGREGAEIERSINLLFSMGADQASADAIEAELDNQWGPMASRIKGGALLGTPEEAVERVLAYHEAGADLVNVALRAPFDNAALDAYLTQVVPAVRKATNQ